MKRDKPEQATPMWPGAPMHDPSLYGHAYPPAPEYRREPLSPCAGFAAWAIVHPTTGRPIGLVVDRFYDVAMLETFASTIDDFPHLPDIRPAIAELRTRYNLPAPAVRKDT